MLRTLLVLMLVPSYVDGITSDRIAHGDETYWTAHGWKTFSLLFVRRELDHPYWTYGLDAPVLAKNELPFFLMPPTRVPKLGLGLIGASVHAFGVPQPRFRKYEYFESVEWNRQKERLPPHATLTAARLPAAVLGIAAALCFFSLLRVLLAPGWAFAGALLLGLNPLVHLFCRRAMADAIAYAFSVAAVLWTIRACQPPDRWARYLVTGVLACAAVSSKLSAGILLPIVGGAFALESALRRTLRPLALGAAAGALAAFLFVAWNPSLYGDPVAGVLSMWGVGNEISTLQRVIPIFALETVSVRIAAAHDLLLGDFGVLASHLNLPVDHVLLALGVVLLARSARSSPAARVLLLWLAASIAAVSLWPPMRFDRYYLPAVAPVTAAECVALAFLFRLAAPRIARALRSLRRVPAGGPTLEGVGNHRGPVG